MKMRPLGEELFHADGQTHRRMDGQTDMQAGMTKLIIAFRNFANAPKHRSVNCTQRNSAFKKGLI
jgi:hypothetical protein